MNKKIIILLAVILIIPTTLAELTIEPHSSSYNKEEQAYFKVCNAEEVKVTELNQKLKEEKWTENCKYYNFNTENVEGTQAKIEAKKENQTKTKTIEIKDYETILEEVLNNKDNDSHLSNAKKIRAKTQLGEPIERLVEQLKKQRIEEYKCWGEEKCDLSDTTNILKHLSHAGFNRSDRVYHDAMLWLESQQNHEEYEEWIFTINTSNNAQCELKVDGNTVEEETFNNTASQSYTRDYSTNEEVSSRCDRSYCFYIYDYFGNKVHESCRGTNKTSTFKAERGCWYDNNRERCSTLITSKAMNLNQLQDRNKEIAKDWVEENKIPVPIEAEAVKNDREILSNLYFYEATENEELRTWLWYSQSNNGSFDTEKPPLNTLEATRIFEEQRNSEWINDALDYLERTRPINGWNDLETDTLVTETMGAKRKPIKSEPSILSSEGENIEFNLESQQEFNLNYELELDKAELELDIEENTAEGTIIFEGEEDGIYTGYLHLETDGYEKSIPIVVNKQPYLNLLLESDYYLQEEGTINVPTRKSESDLTCTIEFSNYFEEKQLNLEEERSITFQYEAEKEIKEDIELEYTCNTEDAEFEGTESFTIRTFEKPPVNVEKNFEVISDEPESITIKNNYEETITVEFDWESESEGYTIESPVTIDKGMEADVYVYRTVESELEVTEPNTLKINSMGYETQEEIEIELDGPAHEAIPTEYREQTGFPWLVLMLVLIAIATILASLYYTYIQANKTTKPKQEVEEESKGEDKPIAETLIAVDKELGETDEEIKKEVKEQGYKDEEIEEMLKELESIKPKEKIED